MVLIKFSLISAILLSSCVWVHTGSPERLVLYKPVFKAVTEIASGGGFNNKDVFTFRDNVIGVIGDEEIGGKLLFSIAGDRRLIRHKDDLSGNCYQAYDDGSTEYVQVPVDATWVGVNHRE